MPSKDEDKLPPGQRSIMQIMRWGTDHPSITGTIPDINLKSWGLVVDGEVERPLKLMWTDFARISTVNSVSDFHCVEGWSVLDCRWEGVLFSNITSQAKPKKGAKYVLFECADGYTTSFAQDELMGDNVLLATKLNGKILEKGLGFPLRLVVPGKYAYKSAIWLTRIHFSSKNKLGYWEERGYSNTADVWKNDRFSK